MTSTRIKPILIACLLAAAGVQAATTAQIDDARAKAYAWMVQQQKGDGSWVDAGGSQVTATSFAAEAMANSGINYGYVAGAAATWLLNEDAHSNDALARQITALAAMGIDTGPLVQRLLSARSVGQSGAPSWGAYPGYAPGMPDTALGLEAMQVTGRAEAAYTVTILSQMQLASDGGWAYGTPSLATRSSLIPTAHAVRVLAGYVIAHPDAKSSSETSITSGVNWLLAQRKNDKGFAEDLVVAGGNDPAKPGQVFETALVRQALNAANQAGFAAAQTTSANTAISEAEDFLLNKQQANGSWSTDAMQTANVLNMWSATGGVLPDTDHDGVPNAVETAMATNDPAVADMRGLPKGNGNPVAGINPGDDGEGDVPTLPQWGLILMGTLLMLTLWSEPRRYFQRPSIKQNKQ